MYASAMQFREYLRSEYRKVMSFQSYLAMLAARPV